MKTNYLFPNYVKTPALIVFVISLLFGLYLTFINSELDFLKIPVSLIPFEFNDSPFSSSDYYNMNFTIDGILLIISSILLAFSKEKEEDEYIAKIRLESLVWATYINYGLLLLAFVLIYNFSFFSVMMYNMFTLLIIFLVRFNFYKFKLQKSLKNEE